MAELSNDPLGAAARRRSPTRSTTRARSAWPSWPSRPASRASSTCPRAASTAWPTATVDETSPVNPQTAYAECKTLVERDLTRDGRRRLLARRSCATPPPSAPRRGMRFDIVLNNLSGLAWTTEADRHDQRRHALAPAGARAGHRQGDPLRARRAARRRPQRDLQRRLSEQNYQVRDIAEIVAAVFPGCEVTLRRRRRRQPQLPGDLRQDQQRAARLRAASGTPQRGAAAAARAVPQRSTWTRRRSPAAATPGSKQLEHLIDTGRSTTISSGRRAAMIIHRHTAIEGVADHRPRAALATTAASSPGRSARDEFADARPRADGRAVQHLVQPQGRHAARHALPGAAAPPRPSWCAAPAARSSTSSSTCARTRRPTCSTSAVELTADNRRALYVPPMFAHGYQTLTDNTEVLVPGRRAPTRPAAERGLRYDDPALGIEWPLPVDRRSATRTRPGRCLDDGDSWRQAGDA